MPPQDIVRDRDRDRDLVLPPNTFAYVLDSTKGKVSVYVGPFKNSLSNTDQLVIFDAQSKRFVEVSDLNRATQTFAIAGEGQYIVLSNPAVRREEGFFPTKGATSDAVDLEVGRKINIPGPATFPLWPGQTAQTIDGHHLRHNQYLTVRVYNETQARDNWSQAVMKPQVAAPAPVSQGDELETAPEPRTLQVPSQSQQVLPTADELTIGQLLVVKGTEVSFFLPPTGIEVIPEADNKYVREAVTLERLEYCILLAENGDKRYVIGPAVVFPEPTEKFVQDENHRKFRAIELNENSGLYVKVIADYKGEDGKQYKVGEELFITGKELAIYFPRAEHSIIQYDKTQKHHAIAIPAGEGRYVLNRRDGTVELAVGPKMFLPDPRTEVVVRRILDAHTVDLLYPDNREAQEVNARYRHITSEQGLEHLPGNDPMLRSMNLAGHVTASALMVGASDEYRGDAFKRGTSFTPPRTIVLDTKYEGAVAVNIWPGYAVLVTKKTGERRVETGPKMVLLKYDETLSPLTLSTGRPKSETTLLNTAYLRVLNNQVSDQVTVETRDLVKVKIDVSYRVNFEGTTPDARLKWFDVENYVKVLTDHARSRMRNAAKQNGIQEFYTDTISIIRDAILGTAPENGKRPGMAFVENGMLVYDVEVLNVSIEDRNVGQLLVNAQSEALSGAIRVSSAQESAKHTATLEELKRKEIEETEKTAEDEAKATSARIKRQLTSNLETAQADAQVAKAKQVISDIQLENEKKGAEQKLALAKQEAVQALENLHGETEEYVKRMGAVNNEMIGALQMFGDKLFVEKVTEAVAPLALASGVTSADVLLNVFKGTPFEGILSSLAERPFKVVTGGRAAPAQAAE